MKSKLLLLLAAPLLLTGCTFGQKASSEQPASSASGSESSSESSSSESSSSEIITFTAQSVAGDVAEIFFGDSSYIEANSGGSYSLTYALNMGEEGVSYTQDDADEELLCGAINGLLSYLPTYLTKVAGPTFYSSEEDWWEDESGDTAADAFFLTSDSSVVFSLYSYVYNSKLLVGGFAAPYSAS